MKWNPGNRHYLQFRTNVMKFIVSTGSAFRTVEDKRFRDMCSSLNTSAPYISA